MTRMLMRRAACTRLLVGVMPIPAWISRRRRCVGQSRNLRPSLRKKELPVADRMLEILDGHRSHSLTELARDMGRSKGQVSKLWHGVAGKVAEKIRGRK